MSVSLSVRLPDEDAAFIAELALEGAVTPSDKLRLIIRDARLRAQNPNSYDEALKQAQDAILPVIQQVRRHEFETDAYSELLDRYLVWLAEANAFTITSGRGSDLKEFSAGPFETGVAMRIFRLMNLVLRMGTTVDAPCYDAKMIDRGLRDLADVMKLVQGRLMETQNG
jgi:hypothetical protein